MENQNYRAGSERQSSSIFRQTGKCEGPKPETVKMSKELFDYLKAQAKNQVVEFNYPTEQPFWMREGERQELNPKQRKKRKNRAKMSKNSRRRNR